MVKDNCKISVSRRDDNCYIISLITPEGKSYQEIFYPEAEKLSDLRKKFEKQVNDDDKKEKKEKTLQDKIEAEFGIKKEG